MDKYTNFKNRIDSQYLDKEVVEETENTISLADLVDILEMRFDNLRLTMDSSDFQQQINRDRTVLQRVNLFRKREVVNMKCTSIISDYNDKRCRISFGFEQSPNQYKFVVIMKDRDSDELYFEADYFSDKEFATKYVSEIYGMFAILEEYATMFPVDEKGKMQNSLTQTFDDGFLAVTVTVYYNGSVRYNIVPSKEADPEKLFNREWLNRTKLSDYVSSNSDAILNRIPVEVSSLDETFRTIVSEDLSKDNSIKLHK